MKRSQIIHEFKLFLDYWKIRKEYLKEVRKVIDIPLFYKTFKYDPPYDYIYVYLIGILQKMALNIGIQYICFGI